MSDILIPLSEADILPKRLKLLVEEIVLALKRWGQTVAVLTE